jgi:hypothetical protein
MAYPDPTETAKIQANADDLLRMHNRSARRPLDGETPMSYRRSLAGEIQQVTPNMKNINLREAVGTAFDLIEKQIYDEARREAQRPSNIPDGELREMRKFDASGRPFYEFYGRASTWMDDFSNGTKKRVVGFKQDPNVRYTLTR